MKTGLRRSALAFEPCEVRRLLAAGAITGTVFEDLTGGGFSPDDPPQPNVTVELYADNGDGVFSPADPLIATDLTDANGEYGFFGLASGTYYIQEIVPGGFVQTGGPPYYTAAISDSDYGPAATDVVIDSFDSPGTADSFIISLTSPDPTLAKQLSNLAIGGERDLLVDVQGTPTPVSAAIELGAGTLNFTTAVLPGTIGTLQYDGIDPDIVGPPAALVNAEGLAVDLTNGGVNDLLRLDFLHVDGGDLTQLGYQIRMTSLGGGTAVVDELIDQNVGPISDLVPFASFAQMGGFSFEAVTSIEFIFNPAAVHRIEFRLDLITATNDTPDGGFDFANFMPQAACASLSGFVYADVNDNGLIDPGELGIPGVTITLTGIDINGDPVMLTTMTAANGFYIFEDLLPGTYKLTETQPIYFVDGKDTIGTPGGVTSPDMFSDIMLTDCFAGVQNNFGERGLVPDQVTKWLLIIHDNPWQPAIEPPSVEPIDPQFVVRGTPLVLQVEAFDPSGRGLTYSLGPNSPQDATIDPVTGVLTWPTDLDSPAQVEITAGVADTFGQTASTTFTVFVIDAPSEQPPSTPGVVVGTAGNDVIEFYPGASPRLLINGAFVSAPAASSLLFQTGGGYDRLVLHDTADDDTFEGSTDYARWFASQYGLLAVGFAEIEVKATQGHDVAVLKDSAGDDTLDARPDHVRLSGAGFAFSAIGFETTRVYASTGFDVALLANSPGDDTLTSKPNLVEWSNAASALTASRFDRVRATAGAGFDRAFLYDSSGDDTLMIHPDRAELTGPELDAAASRFDRVRVFASGGFDRAFLYDSSSDDDLYLYSNRTELKGANFDNTVYGFDRLRAFASGGFDRAFLYDSEGDDDLYLYANRVELKGTAFDNIVYDFNRVRAFASAGFDRAFLYDSAGDDDVSLFPNRAEVIGAGFNNIVYNFDRVRAFASTGLDRAFFYDSSGDDVFKSSTTLAQMTGTGYDNYAYSFDRVRAYATSGNDQAELVDSALDEQLTATGNWASLTNENFMLWIQGFDWAKAMATSGGVNTSQVAALNFVLEQEGDWLNP